MHAASRRHRPHRAWPGGLGLASGLLALTVLGGWAAPGGEAAATDEGCPPGGTIYSWEGLEGSWFGQHCGKCHQWDLGAVLARQTDIVEKLTQGNMPPFVPLTAAEQAPFLEWLACGAPPVAGGPLYRRGDASASGSFDIGDAILVLRFLFDGGVTISCLDAADGDASGRLEVTDAIAFLQYLFLGSAALPDPFLYCGSLPRLGCVDYAPCQ